MKETENSDTNEQWFWCYMCRRCYRLQEAIKEGEHVLCGYYPDCMGFLKPDGWRWSDVRLRFVRTGMTLPAVPEYGVSYLDTFFKR